MEFEEEPNDSSNFQGVWDPYRGNPYRSSAWEEDSTPEDDQGSDVTDIPGWMLRDSAVSSNVNGSSHGDDDPDLDNNNRTDPLIFPNRATLNSAAARFMDRENAIEGHRRPNSGEGSSSRSENIQPNVSSRPSFLRPGTMPSQFDLFNLGQSQSPSSEAITDCYVTGTSQALSSQIDSDCLEIGSRKRRRPLSPLDPPQSLFTRPIPQHDSPSRSLSTASAASHITPEYHPPDANFVRRHFTSRIAHITSSAGLNDTGRCASQVPSPPIPQAHKRQRSFWHLPPNLERSASLFLISELYPRSFDAKKKAMLDSIFQNPTNCVPLAVTMSPDPNSAAGHHVANTSTSVRRVPDLPLGAGGRGWPLGRIPLEVFHDIVDNLPRASVQAMRLVNAEFEMKTSNRLFHTVVVPFRPEIYGMMTHKSDPTDSKRKDVKGKGKAQSAADEEPECDRSVHDGMKVFEAWGPHIKKFAMAFEVDEVDLEQAPIKGRFEDHDTWWGSYKWPHPYYFRYEFCQGLEKKADEFKCMSEALSHLKGTQELGLSLNSGLGWLSGPDMSDRARMFHEKPEIFGRNHLQPSLEMQEREKVWTDLADSFSRAKASWSSGLHPRDRRYFEANPGYFLDASDNEWHYPLVFEGVDLATKGPNMTVDDHMRFSSEGLKGLTKLGAGRFTNAPLKPSDLSIPQQEWLLETEWAQRAFLSSFCMALADNSPTFQHVHTLNISKLSSRYLGTLARADFWKALPNLSTLTIIVSPDWRDISKLDTGLVKAPLIDPSKAATRFHRLLHNHVARVRSIKKLKIGYVGGGEHQTGIYGRNKSVLPAPLMNVSDPSVILADTNVPDRVLKVPSIKSISFENCWMTPAMLQGFALSAGTASLQELHLISVSLTANPGFTGVEELEFSPADGIYDSPQQPPRIGCPSVGNFFDVNRSPPPYSQQGWPTTPQRIGSWANVLDNITPGPTRDFMRYVYGYSEEPPPLNLTNLQRITLDSCGYVHLSQFKDFVGQEMLGETEPLAPILIKRAAELQFVMMTRPDDVLLGQIVPRIHHGEYHALKSAYGMRFGWGDDDGRSLHNREDGQLEGGKGRFSGVLRKLIIPSVEVG